MMQATTPAFIPRAAGRPNLRWLFLGALLFTAPAPAQDPAAASNPSAEKAQTTAGEPGSSSDSAQASPVADADAVTGAEARNPASAYGLWVLAPALIAILLAIVARQVVPALVVGVVVGSYMMLPYLPPDAAFAGAQTYPDKIINGFRLFAETFVLGSMLDPDNLKIIVFTLVIGFMVGVIGRNGGTSGLVSIVAGETCSPRRSGLTAWLAGMVVFFDDYANTMIVGPTMRSVFDRVKLSRAKLAYIIDSTAAPVASLALIGTWVGAEVGFIQKGLADLEVVPSFLMVGGSAAGGEATLISPMQAFISSLPYRFYPILALVLVFLIAWTRRDFGPMRKSESRALTELAEAPEGADERAGNGAQPEPCWWLGLLPVLALVGITVFVLARTGLANPDTVAAMEEDAWATLPWWERAGAVIGNADSYIAIFYGAILSSVFAVLLTLISRAVRMRDAVDAGIEGMARMFPAVIILVLAWSLSAVLSKDNLMLGAVVSDHLQHAGFPVVWAPLAIFVAAAFVSFATGSSWGTMGILCPVAVSVVAGLAGTATGLDDAELLRLFYASVGSVLAGAIFGDHCSPISDTTVLSSVAAGCRHEEHVWTQLPYALVAAVVAMGLGDVLCSVYHQPWYYGLGAGAVVLLLIVLIFGRRPKPMVSPGPPESRSAPPPNIERRLRDLGLTPASDEAELPQ